MQKKKKKKKYIYIYIYVLITPIIDKYEIKAYFQLATQTLERLPHVTLDRDK